MKKQVVGYARVSTGKQGQGTSLAEQRRLIEEYAERNGLPLSAVFVDEGISGSLPLSERPQGRKMEDLLAVSEASIVIISKLDRGFRSATDCLGTVERWAKGAISLHILDLGGQAFNTSAPVGKFFLTVMAGAAEMERNMISERCNEGRRVRRAEGKRLGEIPYGWDLGEKNQLVENRDEQARIKAICAMRAGGWSLRRIAVFLGEIGVPTKKGGAWHAAQIKSICDRAALAQ